MSEPVKINITSSPRSDLSKFTIESTSNEIDIPKYRLEISQNDEFNPGRFALTPFQSTLIRSRQISPEPRLINPFLEDKMRVSFVLSPSQKIMKGSADLVIGLSSFNRGRVLLSKIGLKSIDPGDAVEIIGRRLGSTKVAQRIASSLGTAKAAIRTTLPSLGVGSIFKRAGAVVSARVGSALKGGVVARLFNYVRKAKTGATAVAGTAGALGAAGAVGATVTAPAWSGVLVAVAAGVAADYAIEAGMKQFNSLMDDSCENYTVTKDTNDDTQLSAQIYNDGNEQAQGFVIRTDKDSGTLKIGISEIIKNKNSSVLDSDYWFDSIEREKLFNHCRDEAFNNSISDSEIELSELVVKDDIPEIKRISISANQREELACRELALLLNSAAPQKEISEMMSWHLQTIFDKINKKNKAGEDCSELLKNLSIFHQYYEEAFLEAQSKSKDLPDHLKELKNHLEKTAKLLENLETSYSINTDRIEIERLLNTLDTKQGLDISYQQNLCQVIQTISENNELQEQYKQALQQLGINQADIESLYLNPKADSSDKQNHFSEHLEKNDAAIIEKYDNLESVFNTLINSLELNTLDSEIALKNKVIIEILDLIKNNQSFKKGKEYYSGFDFTNIFFHHDQTKDIKFLKGKLIDIISERLQDNPDLLESLKLPKNIEAKDIRDKVLSIVNNLK
jgi:hypothetical protein